MLTSQLVLFAYGLLLIVGGYWGMKAGSKISCITGSISGLLVFAGIAITNVNLVVGYGMLAGIAGLLAAVFFVRLFKTHRFMPSGMLALLSLAACFMSVYQLF